MILGEHRVYNFAAGGLHCGSFPSLCLCGSMAFFNKHHQQHPTVLWMSIGSGSLGPPFSVQCEVRFGDGMLRTARVSLVCHRRTRSVS